MSEPGFTIAIVIVGAAIVICLWLVHREALREGRAKGYWEGYNIGYDRGYEDAEAAIWPADVSVSHSPSLSHSPSPSQAVDDLLLGEEPAGLDWLSSSTSPSPAAPLYAFCKICNNPVYSWDDKYWSHRNGGWDLEHKAVPIQIEPAPSYLRGKCKWCGEQVFSVDDGKTWWHAMHREALCTDAKGRVHRAKPRE